MTSEGRARLILQAYLFAAVSSALLGMLALAGLVPGAAVLTEGGRARALFQDPNILSAYLFTLGFALITVIAVNVIAFALAVMLTSRIRFQTALRTIFVIPMVISGIIIAFVFKFLFSNSLPALGAALGIDVLAEPILANENLAWLGIVIVTSSARTTDGRRGIPGDPSRPSRGLRRRRRRGASALRRSGSNARHARRVRPGRRGW